MTQKYIKKIILNCLIGDLEELYFVTGFYSQANFRYCPGHPQKNVDHFKSDPKVIIFLLLARILLNP